MELPSISITIFQTFIFIYTQNSINETGRKKIPEISKTKVLKKTSMSKLIESFLMNHVITGLTPGTIKDLAIP